MLSENDLHGFGNLCLMSASENSSLSNDIPKQKAEILESQRNKMAPLSLKLELMIATLENKSWNDEAIKAHKNKVFEILKEDVELAL